MSISTRAKSSRKSKPGAKQAAGSQTASQNGKTRKAAQAKPSRKSKRAAPAGKTPPIAELLLSWYATERRDLPWRAAPGEAADPYRVWLSEIMLQQTTVRTVAPYFERFCARWPTVDALAAADREEVLSLWAGLGYYSRANNLHRCAQAVVAEYDGAFPADELELRRLPGIGPYTAAAISAIAFARKATPVDGNIERVMSRVFAIETPLPDAKPLLKQAAESVTPGMFAGDFAQAQMDLGATVCTPRKPSCLVCPLKEHCAAYAAGIAEQLPRKRAKKAKPTRHAIAFVALREDGHVLLRKRAPTGLLANMIEVPSTEWTTNAPDRTKALDEPPVQAAWWTVPGTVRHVFTHFNFEVSVVRAIVARDAPLTLWADQARCRWVHRDALDGQALPTVMRKILAQGLSADADREAG
ncbi:MAG: A/G-specific adenine glycosylase [Pseudomonadota bacterium]